MRRAMNFFTIKCRLTVWPHSVILEKRDRVFRSAIGVSDQLLHERSCGIFILYLIEQKIIPYRIVTIYELYLALYDL
jgi:hypothetical protein